MQVETESERTKGAASELKQLLGSWRLKHDVRVRMGASSFTLPARSIVSVSQIDKANHKVMVHAGPHCCDWLHESWLDNHCEYAA